MTSSYISSCRDKQTNKEVLNVASVHTDEKIKIWNLVFYFNYIITCTLPQRQNQFLEIGDDNSVCVKLNGLGILHSCFAVGVLTINSLHLVK